MRALVTAEWTDEGTRRLAALGYDVVPAGWGVTRQALTAGQLVPAATHAQLLLVELEQARGSPTNVDVAACAARGIPVLCTPGRNADSVADFTIGLVLALARGIVAGDRHLRDEGWLVGSELPYLHFRGPELAGRTLGVVGYGAVGRRVAHRASAGFGIQVVVHDPYAADVASLPLAEMLAVADVVTLHCPRSPETEGLLGERELGLMRRTSYLINTAGGSVVDEDALVAALRAGTLRGAALDVFGTEPCRGSRCCFIWTMCS